jgi:hypothetical protein
MSGLQNISPEMQQVVAFLEKRSTENAMVLMRKIEQLEKTIAQLKPDANKLYTAKEAAEILGYKSAESLKKILRTDKRGHYQQAPGKKFFITHEQLMQLKEERKRVGTDEPIHYRKSTAA